MNRTVGLIVIAGLAASAQVVDKKALTLEGAKKVIAAAEAEAVKNHVGCNIAVVDDGGVLTRPSPPEPACRSARRGRQRSSANPPRTSRMSSRKKAARR